MSRPLQGKVAIVTGGSRGIGAEISKELARRGASVALTYVSSPEGAQATVSQIESESGGSVQAIAIQADCSQPTTVVAKLVAEVVKKFGNQIDIIVNNAANGSDQTLDQVDAEIFDTMFHTNVLFPLLLVKESVPYFSKGGRIVNISSSGARTPMPYSILYSATKAALESITRTLAQQLGESHEITVNAVNPGPVKTDMWTGTDGVEEVEKAIIQRTLAAKRIGLVDDIAPIVAFLCDPSARWITANVTCANGGLIIL
ncbi:hypothetical protein LTR84_007643 [Exophiala bonariae]|uniref:Uncharacterized protein n=1 Tax=Exophiala bonariae TaxID=1690606 RepID=A0AAV9NKM7_9EURO|nr:hypothetical protein LTR84_007643 [Exophiala bonariae]